VEAEDEILQPATCCPKCYEVMTELKQEIAEFQDRLLDAQNCIAEKQQEIDRLAKYKNQLERVEHSREVLNLEIAKLQLAKDEHYYTPKSYVPKAFGN
jgi:chromosome segregation ATPase